MIAEDQRIALFNSPTRVMKAERLLRKAGLPCRIIPAPRQVAEGCALALRFAIANQAAIFNTLAAGDLMPRRLYEKIRDELFALPLSNED